MSKNDGGTAFPMQDPQAIHAYAQAKTEAANAADVNERDQIYLAARAEAVSGMSLRDYFAAKALESIAGTMGDIFEPHAQSELADCCYKMADAMLAARVKP